MKNNASSNNNCSYPHCDPKILHAPTECKYCDDHPDWQDLRMAWGIAFTGHEPITEAYLVQLPCPADFNRGDNHKKWPGNRACPEGVDEFAYLKEIDLKNIK